MKVIKEINHVGNLVIGGWSCDNPICRSSKSKNSTTEPESISQINGVPCTGLGQCLNKDCKEEIVEDRNQTSPSFSSLASSSLCSKSDWNLHSSCVRISNKKNSDAIDLETLNSFHSAHLNSLEKELENGNLVSLPVGSILNTAQSPIEGKFQKFKKSLSLRLPKKGSRVNSGCNEEEEMLTFCFDNGSTSHDLGHRNTVTHRNDQNLYENLKFGHPIFRTSRERKRFKIRQSKIDRCNSASSDDSCFKGKEIHASNYNECSETYPTIYHDLTKHKGHIYTQKDMNRSQSTSSQTCMNDANHRHILGRQYSSPQPIKDRPFHRLPDYSIADLEQNVKPPHTKNSTNLRRSISQPLDLDKSFQAQVSFLKIRSPHESSVQKCHRRPSVGNLLNDDNTSEEDDDPPSDTEDLRQGLKHSVDEELIVFAEALWDHVSLDADELVFKAGDLITVVDSSDKEWWWGRIGQRSGWFPASFVRLLVNQNEHENKESRDCLSAGDDSRKASLFSVSQDQVRANVINEIISTERDYSKHLRDVVEGYLRQVRKRPDMFSEETISTIFGNMESLHNFHTQFLSELEECIDYESPHRSCIGECFIRNRSKFEIYSEYCNNHPSAVSELQELYQDQRYVHFFEACRLLQQMIDISLDGFLLTPVQKICKYPLQLQELLKYTRASHIDYSKVLGAMRAMREVALLVNERRRRMECLEKIASWQRSVESWEGPELLEDSSQLIHQGEVIKGIGGAWPKEVNLFLFDHQMVYCKRDLLKRNTFVYRGRINTDLCEVIDIPDDPLRNVAFHNSWKIHCLDKGKTYVFTCKTANEKTKWIQAFRRERALVAMDEASGFVVTEKQKQVARMAAKNQRIRPKKPRIKADSRKQKMTFAQAQLLIGRDKREDTRSNSLPSRSQQHSQVQKKKGHWFSFGGHKKNRNGSRTQKHNSFHVS